MFLVLYVVPLCGGLFSLLDVLPQLRESLSGARKALPQSCKCLSGVPDGL